VSILSPNYFDAGGFHVKRIGIANKKKSWFFCW